MRFFRRLDREYGIGGLVVFASIVAFFALVVVTFVVETRASARCLAAGYPESKTTVGFASYCVKRVDQTDVVVPLADAVGEKR